jgi:hypothetical protein
MKGNRLCALVVVFSAFSTPPAAISEDRIAPIAPGDFARLLTEIKPQPGESPWRDIPWLTNITEARRRAVAEDKPLVIFTAADGSPLGRT